MNTLLAVLAAVELPTRSFLYTQDFEEDVRMLPWFTRAKYTPNFIGVTDERSASGRSSFKLDVTFESAGRLGWKMPLRVPADWSVGRLTFNARILVGEETTGGVDQVGVIFVYPPSGASCEGRLLPWPYGHPLDDVKGEWAFMAGDVRALAESIGKGLIDHGIWGATVRNTTPYVTDISLILTGGPGQRVVLYVDDITVEGDVPVEDERYREEIRRRWQPCRQLLDRQIAAWEETLAEAAKEENALAADTSPQAEEIKQKLAVATKPERVPARRL